MDSSSSLDLRRGRSRARGRRVRVGQTVAGTPSKKARSPTCVEVSSTLSAWCSRTQLGATPVPADPTQLAVLAVDVHDVFLQRDEAGGLTVVDPGLDALANAVARASWRS